MVDIPDDERIPQIVFPMPTHIQGLLERVPQLFHCMTGPPRAYFDIPTQLLQRDQEPEVLRLEYTVVGFQQRSARAVCEESLVKQLMAVFFAARLAGCDLLFWRRAPFCEELDTEGVMLTRVGCRVHIPGFDLREFRAPWNQPL